MKAIIFDLDDTLILWKEEFINALKNVLNDLDFDYNEDMVLKINKAIDDVELNYDKLTNNNLLNYINNTCNINLPADFVKKLIIAQKELYYKDTSLEETLNYLSSKYDLYIITNWFTETQKARCENMNIAKYFKKIIGADENYYKPDSRAYKIIMDIYGSDNCIVVGDNLKNDVLTPLSLGMDAYYVTKEKVTGYKCIKNVNELRNIL